jgi:putative nucleotidyltransferase with HDIG domain
MSGPDRRHAVGVAREALRRCEQAGVSPGRDVVAAALLHDVGKIEARLGTFARVAVTVIALVVGRERVARWSGDRTGGWRARAGLYVTHDRVGADLLRAAGSEPLTIAWAEQHHLPEARWTVDPDLGAILKASDES